MIDYSNYSLKRIDYAKERLTHNLNQDGLKCGVWDIYLGQNIDICTNGRSIENVEARRGPGREESRVVGVEHRIRRG